MVLNVDVSALTNPGKTGYDGLVKNFEENFQFAFYDGVGLSNILHVKIHALTIRIMLCLEDDYKKLVFLFFVFLLSSCREFSVKGSVNASPLCDVLGAHLNVFD